MLATARLTLTVATHRTRDRAAADCAALWRTRGDREPGHTAVAVLDRRPDGVLGVERYSNTAKHLLWGGALLGGPLLVVCRPAGAELLTAVGLSGAVAVVGHLRRYVDPADVATAGQVLEDGDVGLVIVAVDCGPRLPRPRPRRADRTFSVSLPWEDLRAELSRDVAGPSSAPALIAV
jgi:hypothetical protein